MATIKVLVIQGAGMELRGKTQVEIFGPETLDDINAGIRASAATLDIDVDIMQSNDETAVVQRLASAGIEYAAMIINPSGFTATEGPLPGAIEALAFPCFEVHASNPTRRGLRSTIQPVCQGAICGFGYGGYEMALRAIRAATDD